jgi:GntR family transcriptional regulator
LVARHQQLAETLLRQISEGTFAVGSRLPTEQQLCATYGLARGTVRHSLRRLEELGMISRRPGAGTRVVAAAPVWAYQPVAASAADIVTLAAGTRLYRQTLGEIVVEADLARRMGAEAGSVWFCIQGARGEIGAPDRPICWSEHYVRGDRARTKLLRAEFSVEDVTNQHIEQTISAALLDARLAAELQAEPATAALVVTRRYLTHDGRPVSVGIHTHPADRFQITTTL